MKQTVKFEFYDLEAEVDDMTWLVNGFVVAELVDTPGKVSGPPEDCYPDEYECELTKITNVVISDGEREWTMEQKPKLVTQCLEKIEDELIELAWNEWTENNPDE